MDPMPEGIWGLGSLKFGGEEGIGIGFLVTLWFARARRMLGRNWSGLGQNWSLLLSLLAAAVAVAFDNGEQ